MAELKLQRNKDGTITIRVGRAVEHISTTAKSKSEVFDAVKYAAISKGAVFTDVALTEMLMQ